MSEPPRLDYATLPPDEPVRPGRIALGVAGAALYGVLLVPPALLICFVMVPHHAEPTTYVVPGVVLVVLAWQFAAAVTQAFRGRGRHRRG